MLLYKAAAIDLLPGLRLHIACAVRCIHPHAVQMNAPCLLETMRGGPRTYRGKFSCNAISLSLCLLVLQSRKFFLIYSLPTAETGLWTEVDIISLQEGKAKKTHNRSKNGDAPCKHASLTCRSTSVFLSIFGPYLVFISLDLFPGCSFWAPLCCSPEHICVRESSHAPGSIWQVMSSDRKALYGDCLEGSWRSLLVLCTQSLKRLQQTHILLP